MEQQMMQVGLAILKNDSCYIGAVTVAKLKVDSRQHRKRGLTADQRDRHKLINQYSERASHPKNRTI